MERLVNFRPLFFIFVAFAVGIGFAHYIFSYDYVIISITMILFLAFLIFSIIRKQLKKFVIILMAFIVGLGAFSIDSNNFAKTDYNGKFCAVYGRVGEHSYLNESDYAYVELKDVYIDGKKEQNVNTVVTLFGSSGIEFKVGDILTFNTRIYNTLMFDCGEFASYPYKNDMPYNCTVAYEDITISSGYLTIGEQIRLYIKSLLYATMGEDIASLSYSVLFGDKVDLNEDIKEDFSTSGIAHLLAVSGLHISFIVAVLYFLLKKFKCEGLPRFFIVAVFLFAYCYLCNFTASITRATIMALAFLLIKLLGKQYDLISSIGLAGIIVLLLNPLSVFDAGFLMSFLSVLAIGFLYKSFSRFFKKCKIPEKLADTMAIDITTTIAIVPILANFFGQISLLSWLANLICVPLFAFAYIFLFVSTLLVCIFNFFGFLFFVPEFIFNIIVWISSQIASVQELIIPLYSLDIVLTVIFFLLLFFASRFFMTKWMGKCIAVSMTIIMGLSVWIIWDRPYVANSNTYTQLNSRSPCAVFTNKQGKVMVAGTGNLNYTIQYLRYKNITKVDVLFKDKESLILDDFVAKYKVQNIVEDTDNYYVEYSGFGVQSFMYNDILKAVYVEVDEVGSLIAFDTLGTAQAELLKNELLLKNPKILYQKKISNTYLSVASFEKIFSNEKYTYYGNYYATLVNGSFTFEFEDGIIGKIRSID